MNIITVFSLLCLLIFAFLFFREFMKKPVPKQRPIPTPQVMPQQSPQQPMPLNEIRNQTAQTIPRKNYREVYKDLSKKMQEKKKEEEQMISPQARQVLSNPREAFKTVDTDFEQAKAKMWGLSPLKQPINPEQYDKTRDSTMYWNRKQPTIYALLAIVSFILFLMLGV